MSPLVRIGAVVLLALLLAACAGDEIAITPDLYDVLCAFSDYRRPSA